MLYLLFDVSRSGRFQLHAPVPRDHGAQPLGRFRQLQAYLGHKNIQHTVRYTELAPTRFKNFWRG
jgi:hypothetical protein